MTGQELLNQLRSLSDSDLKKSVMLTASVRIGNSESCALFFPSTISISPKCITLEIRAEEWT